jgi:hypothetical protein
MDAISKIYSLSVWILHSEPDALMDLKKERIEGDVSLSGKWGKNTPHFGHPSNSQFNIID